MPENFSSSDLDNLPQVSLRSFTLALLAVVAGVLAAVVVLPSWLPSLAGSITGQDAKFYWYLSRSSSVVAFVLLWASMAFGLLMTNRMARLWPGAPAAYELHQFVSLLGLAFVLVHALILLGDRYINFDLFQVVVPFSANYQVFFTGLGQLTFYLWLVLAFSFYLRRRIGQRTWRALHSLSFLSYALALVHGVASGSDTGALFMQAVYWLSAVSLLFLTIYRILSALLRPFYKQGEVRQG
jgi:predicted ferric reductase